MENKEFSLRLPESRVYLSETETGVKADRWRSCAVR